MLMGWNILPFSTKYIPIHIKKKEQYAHTHAYKHIVYDCLRCVRCVFRIEFSYNQYALWPYKNYRIHLLNIICIKINAYKIHY